MKRPPIVAILGHVDHGKSTLLDSLRKSRITALEDGGITQSIGAYQFHLPSKLASKSPSSITFIDTPGHKAFAKMRSRGASVADIALLVVAADDGVKSQTIEALNHIKSAGIPFIVVINKIDLPNANVNQIYSQMTENEAAVEGYGGNIPAVQISAKNGTNLSELLEMIMLVYDLQEIEVSEKAPLLAPVIESYRHPQIGSLVNIIVKEGTISVGDQIFAGQLETKVRALIDENGRRVTIIKPGEPAQILGFKEIPPVGTLITSNHAIEKTHQIKPTKPEKPPVATEKESINDEIIPKITLKADSVGTLQALSDSISEYYSPIKPILISSSVGEITESDILLAGATGAIIIGFRVKITKTAELLAEKESVFVLCENIIYRLFEKIAELQQKTIPQQIETGRAKIIKVFKIEDEIIAGSLVEKGKLVVGDRVNLAKNETTIAAAVIKQLKQRAKDVTEVKAGQECGVLLASDDGKKLKITEGQDIISLHE